MPRPPGKHGARSVWLLSQPAGTLLAMIEYLIKRMDGADPGDWPIHKDRYPDVLRPNTLPSRRISGWGNHRIEVAGVEVSFSWEPVGFQVAFEGEIDQEMAARIVTEVGDNLSAAVEGRAEVIQIGGWE